MVGFISRVVAVAARASSISPGLGLRVEPREEPSSPQGVEQSRILASSANCAVEGAIAVQIRSAT